MGPSDSGCKSAFRANQPGNPNSAAESLDAEQRFRHDLARRLHDELQQLLSAARLKAGIVRRKLQADKADISAATEALLGIEEILERAIDESRRLITELQSSSRYRAGQPADSKPPSTRVARSRRK
jgi:signal transduction histidine kinase